MKGKRLEGPNSSGKAHKLLTLSIIPQRMELSMLTLWQRNREKLQTEYLLLLKILSIKEKG